MARKVPVLVRRRIIDELLRDTSRLYDIDSLEHVVKEKIVFKGYDMDVRNSYKRTVQNDLTEFKKAGMIFKTDFAGCEKKPLRYADTRQPNPLLSCLDKTDVDTLQQAIQIVERMGDDPQFRWAKMFLKAISQGNNKKLNQPYVDFHVAELQGMDWFDKLFSACVRQQPIAIVYEPFDAPVEHHLISPYQLRHFNDRWFLI